MSLHQLYNLRCKYCNLALMHRLFDIFPLCVGLFSIFAVSIQILPFFIEFKFASLVFYFSGKVVVNDFMQLSILNKPHERLFQQSVIALFSSLFIIVQLRTSPPFIRIHFKTLRLVCLISSFYKAFMQFLFRSIELLIF